jgi:tRNA pseudouridine55 synthase
MFGLLNLHKPAGKTSRDVVDLVQRLVRPEKAGHAGTLDPLATGVLVVCIGQATRLIEYVQQSAKRYIGTFLLGRSSPTEDTEGEITLHHEDPRPTRDQLEAILPQFIGTILQRPPAYSALKVEGKRAYALARQGAPVELQPRPIEVHSIEIVKYDYPELVLDIRCGSGTYVRSLGRDIAQAAGTSAVMSALVRTQIGPFHLADALDPLQLTRDTLPQLLLPPIAALGKLPQILLSHSDCEELRHGRPVPISSTISADSEAAGIGPDNALVAILHWKNNAWWPSRVFAN